MNTYSVLEASEKLGISTRAVQKRCKNNEVRKKDNKYLITDLLLEKWAEEIESNEPQTNQLNELRNIGSLKEKIKELEAEIEQSKKALDKINKHAIVMESFFISSQHRREIKNNSFKLKTEDEKKEFLKEHKSFWMRIAKSSSDTLKTEMGMV
tara:strand:+ start:119 stop:577 length:459 start_codon:yes stop_codon:yes gene_type:complete